MQFRANTIRPYALILHMLESIPLMQVQNSGLYTINEAWYEKIVPAGIYYADNTDFK